ncbi:MAG: hypothetical protein N4A71_01115 [Carboxylicivirga sp.]|jgi:hypothetical protein|nr:hypothetical protein [Carboxylicivirga sp.]
MKQTILTISLLIISNLIYSQEQAVMPNLKTVFKDSLITESRIGGISLDDCLSDWIEAFNFIEFDNEFFLKNDEELVLSIWSKNEKNIGGITLFSKEFRTIEGLSVGSEIKDIVKIYPDIEINLSEETREEYFSIVTQSNNKTFLIYIESSSGDKLGENYPNTFGPKTKEFNLDGIISRIEVFKR